jgi:hypothetical protein
MKRHPLTAVTIVLLSLSCSKDPASGPDPDPNPDNRQITPVYSSFDCDSSSTTFTGGISSGNFIDSFGGLNPSSGTNFFASGNGNSSITFYNNGIAMNLGDTAFNVVYTVKINIAWYNHNQDGGLTLSDFNALYFGDNASSTAWAATPDPVLEDTWYTWTGEYTPSPADIGKSWKITINYDLPPKRDIAIDFPSEPFAAKKL